MKILLDLFFKIKEYFQKSLYVQQIGFWCIFICYELFVVSFVENRPFPVFNYVFSYAINIGLFYLHLYIMSVFGKKTNYRYPILSALILLEIAFYLGIKFAFDFIHNWSFAFLSDSGKYIVVHAWRGLYFMGFATLFWLFKRYHSIQKENYAIEKSKLLLAKEKTEVELSLAQTKNAFLAQQMNPHLLFNGLNFIYNSNPSESASSKGILLLSDIMRYALAITDDEQGVLLHEEIAHVQNMVELNRLLQGEDMNLKVSLPMVDTPLRIIPLILMTFTENLFKHANLQSKETENLLSIAIQGKELHFHSLNLKKPKPSFKKARAGLGIKNAIQRLNYAYKDAYLLEIKDNVQTFELNLTLAL